MEVISADILHPTNTRQPVRRKSNGFRPSIIYAAAPILLRSNWLMPIRHSSHSLVMKAYRGSSNKNGKLVKSQSKQSCPLLVLGRNCFHHKIAILEPVPQERLPRASNKASGMP